MGDGRSPIDADAPLLTCLVPVRNAAHELPGFFASLRPYCDAVVALDDGSTDDTLALLELEPLVKRIVRKPVREGYRAWNDASNRNRLLRAAASIGPRWILSLDADERIDEEDGKALRAFLERDAVPGVAYGFRNAPMRNGTEFFWPRYIWVYRLFHYGSGQRFPMQKLHFVPIPTSIPVELRIKTTIRIQHLGELTAERRLARFAKYLEADPNRRFQESYIDSIEIVDERQLHRWLPRPVGLPVLLEEAEAALRQPPAEGQPAVSVVILARGKGEDVRATIASLAVAEQIEILVVAQGWTDHQLRGLRNDYPVITAIAMPPNEQTGALRNAGLRAARGIYIMFLEAGARIAPPDLGGWLTAHRQGYVMVTGVLGRAADSHVAAADLFLRKHDGLIGDPAGELVQPPQRCSYARLALHETGGFPEGVAVGDAVLINRELFRRGYLAFFDPSLQMTSSARPERLAAFVSASFGRGRARASEWLRPVNQRGRLISIGNFRSARQLRTLNTRVGSAPLDGAGHWRVAVLVAIGRIAAMTGAGWEMLRAWGRGEIDLWRRRPQMILWIGFDGTRTSAWLVQCDYLQRRLAAAPVPTSLRFRIGEERESASLEDLRLLRRSCPGDEIRRALERIVGIAELDYLIGEQPALEVMLRHGEEQLIIHPQASRIFRQAVKGVDASSSLSREDVELLQRTFREESPRAAGPGR